MPGLIVGIDRGASFTDFAVVKGTALIDHLSVETRDWAVIGNALNRIRERHPAGQVAFSGASTGIPVEIRDLAVIVPEIESIGLGGAALAGLRECLVVSMGTGSAMVHVNASSVTHVGGTGVGGGTIKGLAKLLCNVEDAAALEQLALQGNAARMNLTIGDLGLENISFLSADATVSNFANIKSENREDTAAGILSLVAETIGIIASLCARHAGCSDSIVAVGKVSANQHIRATLGRVGKLYQTRFLYTVHPGCATAYGAALQYTGRK
jgi:type II pantothenate kinase